MSDAPDFNSLSEAEQRAVAERLLRIEESGWKPFWCPLPDCAGDPHPLLDANGVLTPVADTATLGPKGQPVGYLYQTAEGQERVLSPDHTLPTDTLLGRVALDPAWAHNHARADQRLPSWLKPWILFIMSGRGSGKTRTGVEFVTLSARKGLDGAIIGRRGTELENTHVAALIEHAHPEFVPVYQSSKDLLVWPNGAKTFLFSAERPENIRSVNLSYAWVDEAAFMDEIDTVWMNLKLATRIDSPGNPIHFLITSTPTSTKWVMDMEDDDDVEVRRVSTYANRANLSKTYIADMVKKYEGTRMGRQEIHGEVLRDVEGALWNDDIFEHLNVSALEFIDLIESMDDRVLAVDPAGSKGPRSDATGIMGVGTQHFDENGNYLPSSTFFVLGDATIKGTPTEWARQVYKAARLMKVRKIVAEKNFGGDMVKQVLSDFAKLHPLESRDHEGDEYLIEVLHGVQSKETRAEGTVGKYEQGRVTHVTSPTAFGDLSMLEKEQVTWVPKSRGGRSPSPNRIDALVWAVRELEAKVRYAVQQANTNEVLKKLKRTDTQNSPTPQSKKGMGKTFKRKPRIEAPEVSGNPEEDGDAA